MQITIEIPESASVRAAQVVESAARALGWTEESPGTAEEALTAHFEREIHQRFIQHRVAEAKRAIRVDLPAPSRASINPNEVS